MIPQLPAWNAMHPLVVHMPIGVLLLAPLLVLCAGVCTKSRGVVSGLVLLVLVVGAAGAVLATVTGDAAEHAAKIPPSAGKVFHEHEEMGELTRNIAIGVAIGYAVVAGLGAGLKDRFKRPLWIGAHVLVLLSCGALAVALMNTGHLGGRLVHEFGVLAPIKDTASEP